MKERTQGGREKRVYDWVPQRTIVIGTLLYITSFLLPLYIWCAITLYSVISETFLYFPGLIHARNRPRMKFSKPPCGFYIIAHRGGAHESVENTLQSFIRAKEIGASTIEMDVHLTKDQQVVVFHDKNLNRMCNVDKCIKDYNYEDLPLIQDKFQLHFTKGENYECKPTDDRKIPLLDKVLQESGNILLNIEFKEEDRDIVDRVYKTLRKHDKLSQVIWGTGDNDLAQELRHKYPNVPNYCSHFEVFKVLIGYFLGILPFMNLKFDMYQIPLLTDGLRHILHQDFRNPITRTILFYTLDSLTLVCGPMFHHLKNRGIETVFWIGNTEEEFQKCLKYPAVDGIMTDRPQYFVNLYKKQV